MGANSFRVRTLAHRMLVRAPCPMATVIEMGVIKALEAQGIVADIIVETSAGSVVGALYAGGLNGFQIQ